MLLKYFVDNVLGRINLRISVAVPPFCLRVLVVYLLGQRMKMR